MPLSPTNLCRVSAFAECQAFGKDSLCRVQVFVECQALGKSLFAECHILSSAVLSKAGLCRVPEIWHSAKIFALGKSHVSRSESLMVVF